MDVIKIVLTGGPCAGKSTALNYIKSEFSSRGYTILTVSESATDLIEGGVRKSTNLSTFNFQSAVFRLQLAKEDIMQSILKHIQSDMVLVIYDRGTLDGKAYLSDDEFEAVLAENNACVDDLLKRYDAVFHLVTAANGAEEFYASTNVRRETRDEAILSDDLVESAWSGHPYFRKIDNSTDFDGKIRRLAESISEFLRGRCKMHRPHKA